MEVIPTRSASPKYALAEQAILDKIQQGRYAPRSRIPSIRDLARMLQVAPNTVRQAIDRLVEQGIVERRARVGTFVRQAVGQGNAGLFIFNTEYVRPQGLSWTTIEALHDELGVNRQVRAMLMVDPFPSPAQICAELRAMNVGALGMLGFTNPDRQFIRALSELIPTVLFHKELPGVPLPCALPDAAEAARRMVAYFVGRGRRRIGVASPVTEHDFQMQVGHAVELELHERGLPVDKSLWHETSGPPVHSECFEQIRRIVDSDNPPDAMIFTGSHFAEMLEKHFEQDGRVIGRDLDVIALYSGTTPQHEAERWPVMALHFSKSAAVCARMVRRILEGEGGPAGAPVIRTEPELVLPQGRRGAEHTAPVAAAKGGGAMT